MRSDSKSSNSPATLRRLTGGSPAALRRLSGGSPDTSELFAERHQRVGRWPRRARLARRRTSTRTSTGMVLSSFEQNHSVAIWLQCWLNLNLLRLSMRRIARPWDEGEEFKKKGHGGMSRGCDGFGGRGRGRGLQEKGHGGMSRGRGCDGLRATITARRGPVFDGGEESNGRMCSGGGSCRGGGNGSLGGLQRGK